jgi:hypothetical protein
MPLLIRTLCDEHIAVVTKLTPLSAQTDTHSRSIDIKMTGLFARKHTETI